MDLLGFWSYVHADDDVDMGRVVQLARDIVANYEAIRAESIELFLDRDDIRWGDQWRDRIDESLANVAFFIPVLTPRYFTRVECRRELQFFASRTKKLGIRALILPILYIDVPELHEDEPTDPLVALVKEIQWEPWLEYRFADRTSSSYRQAVDRLAQELVSRVAQVERVDVVAAAQATPGEAEEDTSPGIIDRIAALEDAMPRWSETLQAIGREIDAIGEIMTRAAQDGQKADAQGKGFAARLTVARRVANQLAEPVSAIERLGREYATDLAQVDSGVRALLTHGAEQVTTEEPQSIPDYCEFVATLRELATSSHSGLTAIEEMANAAAPLEKMSKDMRPVLRRMRNSLTALVEAREATRSWVELADSLGVDCGEAQPLSSSPVTPAVV